MENQLSQGAIAPIDTEKQSVVIAETYRYISVAAELLSRQLPEIPVVFDLSGQSAGMFKVHGAHCWIRYNPWIFAKHFGENLTGTVPHEVAHYAVHACYRRRGVKPHGPEWQNLMAALGADPSVTFSADLGGIPVRRQQTHRYQCACRTHEVSTTRHNRILKRKAVYKCRFCDGELIAAE